MALGPRQLSHLESCGQEPGAHQGAYTLRALLLAGVGTFILPLIPVNSLPPNLKSCLPPLPVPTCMSVLRKYTWTRACGRCAQLPVLSL